jgi:hypothetical protein
VALGTAVVLLKAGKGNSFASALLHHIMAMILIQKSFFIVEIF